MHFTRMSTYADSDVPVIVRGSGPYVFDSHGRRYLDGLSGLFVSQVGHGRTELAEAARAPGVRAGLLPALVVRAPAGHRAGRAAGRPGPGRPEPGVLHHQRLRGGRVGLEAGQAVLQADRAARAVQGAQPRHRLPRHVDGRAGHHRARRHQVPVRAAAARRGPGAEHELLPGARLRGRRHQRLRPLGRRRDRAGHPARGPGVGRRGVPGAGAELGRLFPAAARVLRPGTRDL